MHADIAITLLFSYYEESKLTIEEISKNFVSYWILLLATFLIKCDSLAVSCESLIGKQISHR